MADPCGHFAFHARSYTFYGDEKSLLDLPEFVDKELQTRRAYAVVLESAEGGTAFLITRDEADPSKAHIFQVEGSSQMLKSLTSALHDTIIANAGQLCLGELASGLFSAQAPSTRRIGPILAPTSCALIRHALHNHSGRYLAVRVFLFC